MFCRRACRPRQQNLVNPAVVVRITGLRASPATTRACQPRHVPRTDSKPNEPCCDTSLGRNGIPVEWPGALRPKNTSAASGLEESPHAHVRPRRNGAGRPACDDADFAKKGQRGASKHGLHPICRVQPGVASQDSVSRITSARLARLAAHTIPQPHECIVAQLGSQ